MIITAEKTSTAAPYISTEFHCDRFKKRGFDGLAIFYIALFILSVLAVSFHYHADMYDHPECPICKTAKVLSSTEQPSPLLLSGQICKPPQFPGVPASLHEVRPVGEPTRIIGFLRPDDEKVPKITLHPADASRASPALHPFC